MSQFRTKKPIEDPVIGLLRVVGEIALAAEATPHFRTILSLDPSCLDIVHEFHLKKTIKNGKKRKNLQIWKN